MGFVSKQASNVGLPLDVPQDVWSRALAVSGAAPTARHSTALWCWSCVCGMRRFCKHFAQSTGGAGGRRCGHGLLSIVTGQRCHLRAIVEICMTYELDDFTRLLARCSCCESLANIEPNTGDWEAGLLCRFLQRLQEST